MKLGAFLGCKLIGLLCMPVMAATIEHNSPCVHLSNTPFSEECPIGTVWQLVRDAEKSQPSISIRDINLATGGEPVSRAASLLSTGFVPPGRAVDPWPFELPLDWNADPFDDRNWRYQLHAWRMIDPLLAAWDKTRDENYLRIALDVMLDWHAYHYDEGGRVSDFQWYDMSVGLRAMKLAYLLSELFRLEVDPTEREIGTLIHLAALHSASLMNSKELSAGNHGLFQLHGLKALCSVVPDIDSCLGHEVYVAHEMADLVSRQFSAEGIHLEHSPAYHFFAYSVINGFLKTGWYDDSEEIISRMRTARENRAWMVHPDKSMVTVGDSQPARVSIKFPDGTPSCRSDHIENPDCFKLKSFSDSGYAMVRSDWAVPAESASMLFFMAAFHSSAHKLPDDLSFEWFESGGRVLTNGGVYSYDRDKWREFVRSTRAHNTIEISGASFPVNRRFAYGSGLAGTARDGNVFLLHGNVFHKSLGALHGRTLLYSPGRWLVVQDVVEAEQPATIKQWFHFAPEFEIVESASGHVALRPNGQRIMIESNARRVTVARGQEQPYLQGWVTRAYGEMEPRYSLGMAHLGVGARMVTRFAFSSQDLESARSAEEKFLK